MPEHALDVARNEVDLEVYFRAAPQTRQRGDLQCVRNEIDLRNVANRSVHGETHAVHADRALARNEAREALGDADSKPFRVTLRIEQHDAADAVDVAGDQVSAERIAEAQRALKVNAPRSFESGRAQQRFLRDIELKHLAAPRDDSKAGTLDADRIADSHAAQWQPFRMNTDPRAFGSTLDSLDSSNRFYETGKHGLRRSRENPEVGADPIDTAELQLQALVERIEWRQVEHSLRRVAEKARIQIEQELIDA